MPGRRVTVIAHELRGFHPAGGMGTATTSLALALAELGHSVEILLGEHSPNSIDAHWREVYDRAGVRITPVPSSERVEPREFEHAHKVTLGLDANPPDVAIAHDFGAPAYAALRLKQAGLAFQDTLFVVFCHGTRRYVADLSPNLAIGDLHAVLGVSLLEQAAVELADVVVSPSTYLVEWMRERGWNLPKDTRVLPSLTEEASAKTPERHKPTPARPAFDRRASLDGWSEVVVLQPDVRDPYNGDDDAAVVLLGTKGTPDPRLVRALHATNADVVTCAVRVDHMLHFFAGDPGGLGAIRNGYGTVALCRRAVLERVTDLSPRARDPSWPLLAELAMAGARIVSVPLPLVETESAPGDVDNDPAGAVLVAQRLERALPDSLRGVARIAAGLARQPAQPS